MTLLHRRLNTSNYLSFAWNYIKVLSFYIRFFPAIFWSITFKSRVMKPVFQSNVLVIYVIKRWLSWRQLQWPVWVIVHILCDLRDNRCIKIKIAKKIPQIHKEKCSKDRTKKLRENQRLKTLRIVATLSCKVARPYYPPAWTESTC